MEESRDTWLWRLQIWLIGRLGAGLLRCLGATWRVRGDGPDPFASGEPVVAATWHRGMLVAAWHWRGRGFAAPVSRSRDGDRVTAVLERLGYADSPRGSSSRGATSLLRAGIRELRRGGVVALLTDGPRGPARQSKPGALALARATGAPLVPVGIAASPCIRFGSWDRAILPLPFARVRYRYGMPIHVPKSTDDAELERLRQEIDSALDTLTDAMEHAATGRTLAIPATPSDAEGPRSE